MTHPESLTILSIPREIPDNPYQRLLYSALRSEGARILDKRPGTWPLLARHPGRKILHVHWLWLKEGLFSRGLRFQRFRFWIRAARRRGWRVVWTVHNWDAHDGTDLETRLRDELLRNCDGLIAHTEATKCAILGAALPRCPVAVIPHGHYREAYEKAPGRHEARCQLKLDPTGPLFLAFGQLRPYKGIDRLIQAFRESDLAASLLVAGGCPDATYRAHLKSLCGQDPRIVLRADHVSDQEVPLLFGAASRVVFPFRKVTTSGSLILSLTFGRPVLIPDFPALREVAFGDAAQIFNDDEDLPLALKSCLESDQATADAASVACCDLLDWAPIGRRTAEFFRSI